jgi:glycine reductase complex component B subunit gamma
MLRVAHYLNQFFGGVGGEDKADTGPFRADGPIGPGMLVDRLLAGEGKVVATVVCGDNYFCGDPTRVAGEVLDLLDGIDFDLFLAGPAFNAGRYGIAVGEMCLRVKELRGVPAVTGMFAENPGLDLYRRDALIVQTGGSAVDMGKALPRMVALGLKLCRGERVDRPADEGCFPHGVAANVLAPETAAERGIAMLLKKMRGETWTTEIPLPEGVEAVPPVAPVADLGAATIALVTEGGLVPIDNPDHLEYSHATRFASYKVADLERLGAEGFQSIHRGFDTSKINQDTNRLLPVDVLRSMEREAVFGRLHDRFFVTTGVATTLDNARKIGKGIAEELLRDGVSAVILTST